MLQAGLTGQKQAVVQHDAPTPVGNVHQNKVLIGWLQHQQSVAGVLRLNCRLTTGLAAHRLPQEVPYALNAGGGVHVAQHPLHGTRLNGHMGLVQMAYQLALFDVHLCAEVGRYCRGRRNAQIPLVFNDLKGTQLREHFYVIILGKIGDLVHRFSSIQLIWVGLFIHRKDICLL